MQNPSVIRTRPRKTAAATRELPWTFVLLVIVCACVVGTGFFFAARQHFNSIDYGIKNSKLRDQLQNLEAEKRRLLLAREVALSPVSMRKAARGLGLRESSEMAQAVTVSAKAPATKAHIPNTEPAPLRVAATRPVEPAQTIVKTVLSVPAGTRQSGETRSRLAVMQGTKKEKSEVAALLKFK
ncbi:MAG: hypothetical protein H0U23_05045 [Blastocatellia bacterium]|nr:hypothetical protein [Blastocatellia bacterium]